MSAADLLRIANGRGPQPHMFSSIAKFLTLFAAGQQSQAFTQSGFEAYSGLVGLRGSLSSRSGSASKHGVSLHSRQLGGVAGLSTYRSQVQRDAERRNFVGPNMQRGKSAPGQPEIYVISDSTGETAKLLISRLLVQYADIPEVAVNLFGYVTRPIELAEILTEAKMKGGEPFIFATLVEPQMNQWIEKLSQEMGLRYVNVMPPLLDQLNSFLGATARGVPGTGISLSKQQLDDMVNKEFISMVEAAQFVRQHTSGQRSEDWPSADVILVGLSRSGKSGIASHLAQRGKKVATLNVEDSKPVPTALFELTGTPIVLVHRDPETLIRRRESRLRELQQRNISGVLAPDYADPDRVARETRLVEDLARVHPDWIGPIDVTYRCESETSSNIIGLMSEWHKKPRESLEEISDSGGIGIAAFLLPAAAALAALVTMHAKRREQSRRTGRSVDRVSFAGAVTSSLLRGLPQHRTRVSSMGSASLTPTIANLAAVERRIEKEVEMRKKIDAMNAGIEKPTSDKHIFIVSDGTGKTAELLLSRLLVQYGDLGEPNVRLFTYITTVEQLTDMMEKAEALGSNVLLFSTLVDPMLSALFEQLGESLGVKRTNVMMNLLGSLSDWLGSSARGVPGEAFGGPVVNQSAVNTDFFRMADAVQFVQQHLSGLNRQDWPNADVVLVGLSRVGKEVVAVYLSQRGVRAACLTVTPGEALPKELFKIGPEKVVVLDMDRDSLVQRRRNRVVELERRGAPSFLEAGYANPERVEFEVEYLREFIAQHPEWACNIDCTDLAVDEVCSAILRHLRPSSS
mmetsp:Transcript_14481/g.36640  ORF Transcript_14481/g.36640 Transcript_14481/m.36640 type:complete len:800 (-) Transcript_14481:127-2526(-)